MPGRTKHVRGKGPRMAVRTAILNGYFAGRFRAGSLGCRACRAGITGFHGVRRGAIISGDMVTETMSE